MSEHSAFLGIALVLLFVWTNVEAQCTETQLPGVLGFSECLGPNPDYCSDRPKNATQEGRRIYTCVLRMLPQITQPIQSMFLLRGLIVGVLRQLKSDGNDPVAIADMMCNPLGFPVFGCGTFFPSSIICGPPINISMPSSFGINNCTNSTLLRCREGETLSNATMDELLKFLTCLLSRSPHDSETLARRLACFLADVVRTSARQFAETFPLPVLSAGIQASAARLSGSLFIRARCFLSPQQYMPGFGRPTS